MMTKEYFERLYTITLKENWYISISLRISPGTTKAVPFTKER